MTIRGKVIALQSARRYPCAAAPKNIFAIIDLRCSVQAKLEAARNSVMAEPCAARAVPLATQMHRDKPPVSGAEQTKYARNAMRTKMIAAVAVSTLLLGSAAFAQNTQNTQNSGAGTPGLPGNKSGPTVAPDQSKTPPDTSGVKGLPGNKSGPAVQPPKTDRTR